MTSALNRPLPLNGNKPWLTCLWFIILLQACSPKTAIPSTKTKPQTAKQPAKDSVMVKPESNVVDTLIWKDVSQENAPITDSSPKSTTPIKKSKTSTRSVVKEKYNIKLLIPLNSSRYQASNLSTNRFVQFYSGMLLAKEDLQKQGVSLNIVVEDTAEPDFDIQSVWDKSDFGDWDMIIGPFEREDVKTIANEAGKRKITMVSPWQTSTKIAKSNEYYIQLKPNLKEHFRKLVEHACHEFGPGKVVVITHDNQEGKSWYQYMESVSKEVTGLDNYISHVGVTPDSLISPNTAFVRLFEENPPKAVILPYYSFTDEEKLYAIVRRLNIDKGLSHITVYGMPLMIDSEKIDFEFYSSLHCRIALSDFVDENQYKVKQFKRRFFETYGELADAEALKGYDILLFAGKNITDYGNFFQEIITGDAQKYLQTEIELQPSYAEDPSGKSTDVIDFYENKKIWIVEFMSSGFEVID